MNSKLKPVVLAAALMSSASGFAASYHLVVPVLPLPRTQTPDPEESISVSLSVAGELFAAVGKNQSFDLKSYLTISGDPLPQPELAHWSIVRGSLVPGLTLGANGVITGVPTVKASGRAQVQTTYKNKTATAPVVITSMWEPVDFSSAMAGFTFPAKQVVAPNAGWAATAEPFYWRTIFDAAKGTAPGTFEFRKLIEIPTEEPISAVLTGVVDDTLEELSVNGQVVATSGWGYKAVSTTQPFTLLPGKNVISLKVNNVESPIAGSSAAGFSVSVLAEAGGRLDQQGGWYALPGHDLKLSGITFDKVYLGETSNISLRSQLQVMDIGPVDEAQIRWTIASGTLPAGLTLDTNTGAITGTPTGATSVSDVAIRVDYKGIWSKASFKFSTSYKQVDYSSLMAGYSVPLVELPGATWVATGSPYYWRSSLGFPSGSLAGTYEYRKIIENNTAAPISVKLRGAVDDSLTGLSLNGKAVALSTPWTYNVITDSPALVLQPGKNVIGVAITNLLNSATGLTNAAGMSLQALGVDGVRIDSNGGWMAVPGFDLFLRSVSLPKLTLWENSTITLRDKLTIEDTTGPVDDSKVSWAIEAGALPAGMVLNQATGLITGAATEYVTNKAVTILATYKGQSVRRSYSLSTIYKTVDYSALMSGFTNAAKLLVKHTRWVDTGSGWYWNTENAQVTAAPGTVEFRKIVENKTAAPLNVQFFGAMDNDLRGMSINGTPVAYNPTWDYTGTAMAEVFSLPPGKNVVSIIVRNAGTEPNPAGFSIYVRDTNGSRVDGEGGWFSQ
ncbi:Ig domain-containing protein [Comamonas thiooxydans]|uniref:Ig domain-containing protein n=1 Tax=Comamonas thiooxydans TaxID=363952 RepID=UPI000B40E870|nr:Ig domain-containing protein [Comamonas thiooxydans]